MSGRKNRFWMIALIGIVVVLGFFGFRFIQSRRAGTTPAGTQVYRVFTVSASDIELTVQGSGTVESANKPTVTAAYAGIVSEVNCADGEQVAAGDVILTYDQQDVALQVAKLRNDITDADAQIQAMSLAAESAAVVSPVGGLIKSVDIVPGSSIDTVMLERHQLMLISVDRKLLVRLRLAGFPGKSGSAPPGQDLPPAGSVVNVSSSGQTVAGIWRDVQPDGLATIVLDDPGWTVGGEATVTPFNRPSQILGTGIITVSQPFPVIASGGVVETVAVVPGQTIAAGQTLYRLHEPVQTPAYRQAIEQRNDLWSQLIEKQSVSVNQEVRSEIDGIVSGLTLRTGDAVKAHQVVATVIDDRVLQVTMNADELDIPVIQAGQAARVILDAFPDKTFAATVKEIMTIGSASGGVTTYPVTLSLDRPEGVMIGMSANATVTVSARTDVPVVPLAAVQTIGNRKFVLRGDAIRDDGTLITATAGHGMSPPLDRATQSTASPSGPAGGDKDALGVLAPYLVEVTTGITTDNAVEILSGVQIGDRLAIAVASIGTETGGLRLPGMGSGSRLPDNRQPAR